MKPTLTCPAYPLLLDESTCSRLPILSGTILSVSPTRSLHRLRWYPMPNLSLSIQWTLVRVCCYPRGTRDVLVMSPMTSAHPIARVTHISSLNDTHHINRQPVRSNWIDSSTCPIGNELCTRSMASNNQPQLGKEGDHVEQCVFQTLLVMDIQAINTITTM